jgi:hypothetical protein
MLAGLATLLCTGCSDACSNSLEQRLPSPDGKNDAVVFVRDCGATTDYSAQLSIVAPMEMPQGAGSVLTTELGSSNAGFQVRWLAPDRLVVQLPSDIAVFKQKQHLGGIVITYEHLP